MRVVAFETLQSKQFTLDLNYFDLLALMNGNMKLLEDENSHDLCQIILNNLSIIKRTKIEANGKEIVEDVLIVEHKIFFADHFRQIYDKKKTNIMAKHDKKR